MTEIEIPNYVTELHNTTQTNIKEAVQEPLIDELLDAHTGTLIWAKTGGMKSLFTLDMVSSIAEGGKFLGYNCHKKKVLYVDGEMSDISIQRRCEMFNCTDKLTNQMLYLGRTLVDDPSWFDLVKPDSRQKLLKLVQDGQFEVVVLDSLRTLFKVENENDSANYNAFVDYVIELRQYTTVIAVHHSNKAGGYAGSTNILTPFDYELQLAPTSEDGVITLRSDKHRDGPGITALKGKLVKFEDGKFSVDAKEYMDLEYLVEKLIDLIEDGGISSVVELADFYRSNGVGIGGAKQTYKHIYSNLFAPFCTNQEYKTQSALKAKIDQNKKGKPAKAA